MKMTYPLKVPQSANCDISQFDRLKLQGQIDICNDMTFHSFQSVIGDDFGLRHLTGSFLGHHAKAGDQK